MRLLLISNSTNPGEGYLDHCAGRISSVLGDAGPVAFVPYASGDLDGYAAAARERFARMGHELFSVHEAGDPGASLGSAGAVFVGGGNTFRLLDRLHRLGLVEAIRTRVGAGAVYMGASAGSNVACPTIKTTNDMPIVEPPTLASLALVPFQINPHYVDRDPDAAHGGETREQRIREFHEENAAPVVGLREGSMLLVDGRSMRLLGRSPARLFERDRPPREVAPGEPLDSLLADEVGDRTETL